LRGRYNVCTIRCAEVTFDAAKDAKNIADHGISLVRANEFDFNSARLAIDDSQDYGEERWNLIGWLDAKLYHLTVVFYETSTHAISLRKATRQERKQYAQI
jgi:uncharacterized DUF497 family protein